MILGKTSKPKTALVLTKLSPDSKKAFAAAKLMTQ